MTDFLRKIRLFSDLSENDFSMLSNMVEEVRVTAGEELFQEGSKGNHAYVIQEGELEIIKKSSGRPVLLAVRGPGEVIGEMALLEDAPRMATVKARSDSLLLALDKEELDQLLESSRSALNALFHNILARLRDTEDMLRQSEKMAQLGTLTAGVAHELNNPAAAISRGNSQLADLLPGLLSTHNLLRSFPLNEEQSKVMENFLELAKERSKRPIELDALLRSDRLDDIENWAEGKSIKKELEEVIVYLVDLDFDIKQLEKATDLFDKDRLSLVIKLVASTYAAYTLMAEIGEGTQRISDIVASLKSYSFLDQAPVQEIDVHKGIEDTLLIFGSRLKEGVNIKREYAEKLPRIQAFASELNQVWTNLIDNAIDAMEGKGEISIRSRQEGDWVIVEVEDNGPGIPKDIQRKIFDPFFTTKPIGKGTGLGLNITYNIIVNKHRGDIRLTSKPGKTNFAVWLPQNFLAED